MREAVRRVLAGETVNPVCMEFNRRGILSPRNHQRKPGRQAAALRCWLLTAAKAITATTEAMSARTSVAPADDHGSLGQPVREAVRAMTAPGRSRLRSGRHRHKQCAEQSDRGASLGPRSKHALADVIY